MTALEEQNDGWVDRFDELGDRRRKSVELDDGLAAEDDKRLDGHDE